MAGIDRYVEASFPHEIVCPKEIWLTFRVSQKVVYEALSTGDLPSVRLGRSYRIEREDLFRWLRRELN